MLGWSSVKIAPISGDTFSVSSLRTSSFVSSYIKVLELRLFLKSPVCVLIGITFFHYYIYRKKKFFTDLPLGIAHGPHGTDRNRD